MHQRHSTKLTTTLYFENYLLERHRLCMLVIILLFWNTNQTMCVKWSCIFHYCYVTNGFRLGGILSPKLYSVYVDDFSDYLVKSEIGCHIDNVDSMHKIY